MDIKNARSNVYWRAFARLFQMVDIANMRIYFGIAKEKAETFLRFPLFIEPFNHFSVLPKKYFSTAMEVLEYFQGSTAVLAKEY